MFTPRPPIVVILGHVDHGKTTLLDYIRKTSIAAKEAGGITQAIRSFQLTSDDQPPITFIDTPGHAAFTAMRARGSNVADICVLVVAGNDGVMPQTIESIKFISAAGIPAVVAINKSDLSSFDPDRVKTQLAQAGLIPEEMGGDTPVVPVSAATGAGIPQLLEMIRLVADLHPRQADPAGPLQALVLESRLHSQKGPLADVLVKSGTLTPGQLLFQDQPVGKVRSLTDSDGRSVPRALPSTPVEILGLSAVPPVGSVISGRPASAPAPLPASRPPAPNKSASPGLNLILKADVAGSLEAILSALPPEVTLVSSGVGDVTETDVDLAQNSQAHIVCFNVRIPPSVAKLAEVEKVPVHPFKIIYELLDRVSELTGPKTTEIILGTARILAQFKIGPDTIAGCRCLQGTVSKSDTVRLMRSDQVVGEARIKSLRIGKSEVSSVKSGAEFGAVFAPRLDFKISDNIIAFTTHGPS